MVSSVKVCSNMSSVALVSAPNFVKKLGGKYMAHIGEVLEKGLKLSNTSITKAAKLMEVSRQTVYSWIDTPNLDQSRLALLGQKIGFDFIPLLGEYADQDVFNYVRASEGKAEGIEEGKEEGTPVLAEPTIEYNTSETFKITIEIDHDNLSKLPPDFSKKLNELLRKGEL